MKSVQDYLQEYYANNAQKLRRIVDKILMKYEGVSRKDYDEFYSAANAVFADLIQKNGYDASKGDFEGYLYRALQKAVSDEYKYQTRDKRIMKIEMIEDGKKKKVPIPDMCLDAPVPGTDHLTVKEIIQSDFNMDAVLEEETDEIYSEKVEKYLRGLQKMERKIVEMLKDGYKPFEIKEALKISNKKYSDYVKSFSSYEKTKCLRRDSECMNVKMEEEKEMVNIITTSEKTKDTSYSLAAISKKLKKYQLRDDHVLQRTSGQWSNLFKSELISDILQGKSLTQIIISEEIKDGVTMHWLIDGKQRCTNIDEFLNDGFAISKNVQRYEIQYQSTQKSENGNDILNEDGFPIPVNKTFDIRKKKFSQLPEELQDRFLEYQMPVMLNLNCSKEEIAYDIARFNRCRPMNVAQNGWTGLEEGYAEFVDNILKMPFFKNDCEKSAYRESNNKSGMMRRMIVESIMAIDFLDDFNKDFGKMCKYLSENANDSNFISFYSLIERLNNVSDERVAKLFNIKDSFLWFDLFAKFTETGLEDSKFIKFLVAFDQSLHSKVICGESFDDLKEKSTKDKNIVIHKLEHLEQLMNEFLHINTEEISIQDFITKNINEEVSQDDIEFYTELLEDLTLEVDNNSRLLDEKNKPSLLAIVGYSCKKEIDLDHWLVDFFSRNHTYIRNQNENYRYMIRDLKKYFNMEKKASA